MARWLARWLGLLTHSSAYSPAYLLVGSLVGSLAWLAGLARWIRLLDSLAWLASGGKQIEGKPRKTTKTRQNHHWRVLYDAS